MAGFQLDLIVIPPYNSWFNMDIDTLKKAGIKIISVDDQIHIVQGEARSRSPFANVILILDETVTLVDTGCGAAILERLIQTVPIHSIINTHSHPDHTGGNRLVQERTGARIIVPADNRDTIGTADTLAVRMVGADLAAFWKEVHLPITGFKDFTPDDSYTEGERFTFGRTTFIALHTPGHTNDHYCLYEPARKILIGADIDLSPFGPWYGNVESDIPAFQDSLERIISMPIEIFISAHTKPVKGPYISRRLKVYTEAFRQRDESILDFIPYYDWISLRDIVHASPIYGYDYARMNDRILHYGEMRMVEKHLDGLEKLGVVARSEAGYKRLI